MTAIDAAAPRVQVAPAEPRYKLPTTPPPSDEERQTRQLAEFGFTPESWAAKMAEGDRRWKEAFGDKAFRREPIRFAGVADAAAEGQRLVSSFSSVIDSANALRQKLASARVDDRTRLLFGEEAAAARLRGLEKGIEVGERAIAGYVAEIGAKFQVQGKLAERDEAGTWRLGAFVLEHQASGFAVRVGSDGRAFAARGGGFEALEPGSGPARPTTASPGGVDLRA